MAKKLNVRDFDPATLTYGDLLALKAVVDRELARRKDKHPGASEPTDGYAAMRMRDGG